MFEPVILLNKCRTPVRVFPDNKGFGILLVTVIEVKKPNTV